MWLPINNLSTTLAVAVQEARARSPAVATVDQLLRQHISSWIGGSNLVCAFPAQLGNGPSAEDRRRHSIADLLRALIWTLSILVARSELVQLRVPLLFVAILTAPTHNCIRRNRCGRNRPSRRCGSDFYWPGADTPGVRLRDAEIAAYGTQEMITLEWQVVGLLG